MRKTIPCIGLLLLIAAFLLSGCGSSGGGDTDSGTTDTDDTTDTTTASGSPSISLSMVNPSTGAAVTSISITEPAQLIAVATDAAGAAVQGTVVTFSATLAGFNPAAGSALTDGNGTASIEILAGNSSGADQATATALVGGETVSDSVGFQVQAANLQLGSGTPFATVAEIGTSPLSAGGTSTVSVTLVDENLAPYTTPVDISFSSPCVAIGSATIDTPVTTLNGTATAVYQADGCVNNDTVTATANIGGQILSVTGTITVLAAGLGSIEFVSASQNLIALRGTGGQNLSEAATLTFRVLDQFGDPVPGQAVDFSLNTSVGGLDVDPVSATSNASGEVQTSVSSGTVATPVRVTASITGTSPLIQSQSDLLIVTTGIPDQDSASISVEVLNPEAFNIDGVTDAVTIRLADRFNNPVPDGTAVTFTSEVGGSVGSGCTTVDGACTVQWVSQGVRPQVLSSDDPVAATSAYGKVFSGGGRVTVTATVIGEESFIDLNGNGVFDDGDTFTDLPEAFRDFDEDAVRDASFEPFFDFDSDTTYDAADGAYSGLLCEHTSSCASGTTLNVRDDVTIVMSTSGAHIEIYPASITMNVNGAAFATAAVWDANGNVMPMGTTITAGFSGTAASVSAPSSITVPNSNGLGPTLFTVTIEAGEEAGTGLLRVDATTPGGVVSTGTIPVTVN